MIMIFTFFFFVVFLSNIPYSIKDKFAFLHWKHSTLNFYCWLRFHFESCIRIQKKALARRIFNCIEFLLIVKNNFISSYILLSVYLTKHFITKIQGAYLCLNVSSICSCCVRSFKNSSFFITLQRLTSDLRRRWSDLRRCWSNGRIVSWK